MKGHGTLWRSAILALGSALVLAAQAPARRSLAALDAVLETSVQAGRAPGVVAIVVDKERVLYLGAAGQMNGRAHRAMRTDAIFRIMSMTKPITAVAVMMLQESGKLSVEDPAAKYLPDLRDVAVVDTVDLATGVYTTRAPSQELRIRHLLSNTSGFGYVFSNPTLKAIHDRTPKATERLPLLHDPGAQWTYGMNARLAGQIVSKVSGMALDRFFTERIFKPLGMSDTMYLVPAAKMSLVPTLSHRDDKGVLVETPNPSKVGYKAAGDGGLFSTASDYAAFLQMLLNEGTLRQKRLLNPESVRAMTSNQIGEIFVQTQQSTDFDASLPFPFGAGRDKFGFALQIAGVSGDAELRSPGSYSWSGSDNTHFWVDPVRKIAVVVMMQTTPFYDEGAMKLVEDFEHAVGKTF
jgi:CubicO group peptidase (beta-lactamase class C family)